MSKPPSLSRTTLLHLRAAEGWAELDSPAEALLELEAIAETERGELPVLEMFWRVYVGWEKCDPPMMWPASWWSIIRNNPPVGSIALTPCAG